MTSSYLKSLFLAIVLAMGFLGSVVASLVISKVMSSYDEPITQSFGFLLASLVVFAISFGGYIGTWLWLIIAKRLIPIEKLRLLAANMLHSGSPAQKLVNHVVRRGLGGGNDS